MAPVFLFGTLRHAPLLRLVAGAEMAGRPAVLDGHRVIRAAGGDWPELAAEAGAGAEGVLIAPGDAALARLDFYEACFGYARWPAEVATAEGVVAADVWTPSGAPPAARPGAAWDLADWVPAHGAVSLAAAEEVMRQAATARPEEIARRFWMIRARAQSRLRARDWRRPGRVGHGFDIAAVEMIERAHPYDGFFTVEELHLRHRRFDGATQEVSHRGVFNVADAVTVLPYDPVRDRILLIEQIRFGPLAMGDPAPWMLEPVAGIVDAGEGVEATARRETAEEAGLDLGDLHVVARYYPSPGGVAQVMLSYVGIADLPDDATGLGGHDGEGEDILSHLVDYEAAVALLAEGDMANAPLILSMQWLMLHRDRLRATAGAGG